MDSPGDYKLKVCGMRDPANIAEVAGLQPDYMGFIFYPQSPRFTGNEFTMPDVFPASIKKIGVFVNEAVEGIRSLTEKHQLYGVQLHGNETAGVCGSLKNEGLVVIKAFSVDDDFDFRVTDDYRSVVDYFLFDTKGKLFGGNARAFNWEVLHRYDQRVPFFLSGGLSLENVENLDTLSGLNLHALDVNSGVEDKPGLKNMGMLRNFIARLNTPKRD